MTWLCHVEKVPNLFGFLQYFTTSLSLSCCFSSLSTFHTTFAQIFSFHRILYPILWKLFTTKRSTHFYAGKTIVVSFVNAFGGWRLQCIIHDRINASQGLFKSNFPSLIHLSKLVDLILEESKERDLWMTSSLLFNLTNAVQGKLGTRTLQHFILTALASHNHCHKHGHPVKVFTLPVYKTPVFITIKICWKGFV